MNAITPKNFRVFCIGPYDSRVILDHTSLATQYDEFRRRWFKRLTQNADQETRWIAEKYNDSDFRTWLDGSLTNKSAVEIVDSGGKTQKDKSLVRVQTSDQYQFGDSLRPETRARFAELPVLTNFELSLHEYGIGIYSGWLDIQLNEPLPIEEVMTFLTEVRDLVTVHPELCRRVRVLDDQLLKMAEQVRRELKISKPAFAYEDVSTDELACRPRWIHIVSFYEIENAVDGQVPFGERTASLLHISHPSGLIDMTLGTPGFLHLGWGRSLGVNVAPDRVTQAMESLRRLEVDWRVLELFNQLLSKKLHEYADLARRGTKSQFQSMDLIDHMKVEVELYECDVANQLHMMAPYMHRLYREGELSWRMPEMKTDYHQKLSSLDLLRQQALTRFETRAANRFNALVGLITCIALTSAVVDFLQLADFGLSRMADIVIVGGVLLIALLLFWPIVRPLIRHDE